MKFYKASADYCDFLREKDKCVPYTRADKSTRPFLGILLNVNGYNYYAPLSSPKPKHLQMKNQLDFMKINSGKWGAINFNNMIPIHLSSLEEIKLIYLPTDTKDDRIYKELLNNQLSWCNINKNIIINNAHNLYRTITEGAPSTTLRERCCNFKVDELQYEKYCEMHNLKKDNHNNKIRIFQKDLKAHGFSPSSKVIAQYSQLCKISNLSLTEINLAYTGKIDVSKNVKDLVTKIGNELRNQELKHILENE